MLDKPYLLVADTAFLDPAIIDRYNLIAVFPQKKGDGAFRASLDDLVERSRVQANYYNGVVPELTSVFQEFMPAAGTEVRHFLRPIIVSLTSLFVDRCIRVFHRIRQYQSESLSVVGVESISQFQWPGELRHTSSVSWHLNQEVVQRIMISLGYEPTYVIDREGYPEFPAESAVPNLLFTPKKFTLSWLSGYLMRRFYSMMEVIFPSRGKILSKGMIYDEFYLHKYGLYEPFGPLLANRNNFTPESSVKDEKKRASIRKQIEPVIEPKINSLIRDLVPDITDHELCALSKTFVDIVAEWFPVGFIEGLQKNMDQARILSERTGIKCVLGAGLTSDAAYYECAVARLEGNKIIGVQHSAGHYGYIQDLSLHAQLEYSYYDKFITNGWSKIEEYLPQCNTIEMPSPKLSERLLASDYITEQRVGNINQRDVLFLSNVFLRFPHASTSGQARVDFIDEITDTQEAVMKAFNVARLTIDHKPFNKRCLDLYPEHYTRLELAGGDIYKLIDTAQKGLSIEQIKTCRIVLWDQIGSGTVECFTSEVPTLVFWNRIYSREVQWAEKQISDLEDCGVIHSDPEKLANEIQKYLADPSGWMSNSARRQAIERFCYSFARIDSDWQDKWKSTLFQLSL